MQLKERKVRAPTEPVECLTIAEIDQRYPGEWVVIRVTALDEIQNVREGDVLCHSSSRAAATRATKSAWKNDPKADIYVRLAGPRLKSVEEWRRVLADSYTRPYVNAHW